MSDDLVSNLREMARQYTDNQYNLYARSADRIEKLETALRLYTCESTCTNCYGPVQDTSHCGWTARKALEEKDD